jgi:hypothetical protein
MVGLPSHYGVWSGCSASDFTLASASIESFSEKACTCAASQVTSIGRCECSGSETKMFSAGQPENAEVVQENAG